ncbi:MAG: UDP-glucose 4-epimerase GalE [Nanoarchaeota archaeon]|nr:UDP-glucose 4-epimerase GalE [Nanoarchaeota archaeon]
MGKILVTGGAGYIGNHVVRKLCDGGYNVVVFDDLSTGIRENVDSRAEFVEGDVFGSDLDNVFSNDVECVFHLAALKSIPESMANPGKYVRTNIHGSIGVLNRMKRYGINKIVFSSSAAVYGVPEYLPIDENHPLKPTNYYGTTKLNVENMLKEYESEGIRYAILRYFNAAGYDVNGNIKKMYSDSALLPVIMEVANGSRERMEVYGDDYKTKDGTCIRDFIHVSDLAEAHLLAMKHLGEESFTVNLSSEKGYSVLEVIEKAKEITGKDIKFDIVGRRTGDVAESVASSKLALEKLGWKTKYSDIDTIIRTMWDVYSR